MASQAIFSNSEVRYSRPHASMHTHASFSGTPQPPSSAGEGTPSPALDLSSVDGSISSLRFGLRILGLTNKKFCIRLCCGPE